jgi:hypothetical protein
MTKGIRRIGRLDRLREEIMAIIEDNLTRERRPGEPPLKSSSSMRSSGIWSLTWGTRSSDSC